ncbi:MAG: DUF975 family protein [Kiritimatiellia bacterium]
MEEVTAQVLKTRARYWLSGPGGAKGYGTYLLGLLLQGVLLFAGGLGLALLFVGAFVGQYAALRGAAPTVEAPTVFTVLGSMAAATVFVVGVLYLAGFATWGQRAMSIALLRGGLTVSHGLSGWGNGWRMVGLILWQQTFVFLWALLLIVPGVRAAFSYAMASFLLVDHPDWAPRTCLAESKRMMEGHRWRYFCLNMSFIGWWLLAALASVGIGNFAMMLLVPYVDAARAAFYEDLLDRADRADCAPDVEPDDDETEREGFENDEARA